MSYTRRDFGKLALAGIPAAGAVLHGDLVGAAMQAPRPMSRWAGVQVGLNVPYSLGTGNNIAAEDLLKHLVDVGVSGVELRAQPVEHFLGSPTVRAAAEAAAAARGSARGGGRGRAGRGTGRATQTPEQVAALQQQEADVRQWRLSAPLGRVKELRQIYENAGVLVEILKVDGLYSISDEEIDFFFQMARDIGARAVSAELPDSMTEARRIGEFADKHQIYMAHHHHAQAGAAEYEEVFSLSPYSGANIDIGHWTATQNVSPLPFIAEHAERIPHIHVKDRRFGTNGGQNVPFGEGDTEVRQILQAIRDNKWNIQATIEFEYPVPEGSSRVAEIKKCLEYCRSALMA